MRIIFICGSLEFGKDGVGDYTRQLACEMTKQGHTLAIVAFNDWHIPQVIQGIQNVNSINLPILRIPSVVEKKFRIEIAKQWIRDFNPDWISLQFVPYSYNAKGLPFSLSKDLTNIGENIKWHLMFHEGWVKNKDKLNVKSFLIEQLQKRLIKDLVVRLCPTVITTSNYSYHNTFLEAGISTKILTLPSNIPISNSNISSFKKELNQLGLTAETRSKYYVLGTFGSIRPDADLKRLLELKNREISSSNLKLAFLGIGRLGKYENIIFNDLKSFFGENALIHSFGERSPEDISAFFQLIDIGVATVPLSLFGKSGSVSAMRYHRLKVISTEDFTNPKEIETSCSYFNLKPQAFSPVAVAEELINQLQTSINFSTPTLANNYDIV